jgi:hypothetical protein
MHVFNFVRPVWYAIICIPLLPPTETKNVMSCAFKYEIFLDVLIQLMHVHGKVHMHVGNQFSFSN